MKKELLINKYSFTRDLSFFKKYVNTEKLNIKSDCSFDAIYAYQISNCYVSPYGVVYKNGAVIKESLFRNFGSGGTKELLSFYKKILLAKKINVKGHCIVAHHSWYDNYYHFMIEILPRLYLLKDIAKENTLLIHENIKPFHRTIIAMFGFKEVVYIGDKELAKVEHITFPNFNHQDQESDLTTDFSAPGMNKVLMQQTGEWVVSNSRDVSVEKYPLIYISRKKAMHRKVLNEDELVSCLEPMGFKTIYFEDHDLKEQVNFIRNAKTIIGVCGAGLSNILFMNKGARVYNLINKDVKEFCFYNLAQCIEAEYIHFICEGNSKPNAAYNDIIVNIEELKVSLESQKIKI